MCGGNSLYLCWNFPYLELLTTDYDDWSFKGNIP